MFHETLAEAEMVFGPRDPKWESFCIRYHSEAERPRIDPCDSGIVAVWLNPDRSRIGYRFEIAHEVVHCLNPISASEATYLEEAVAVAFSLRTIYHWYGKYGLSKCKITDVEYTKASKWAGQVDSDVVGLGKNLRKRTEYGSLSLDVTAELLAELYPNAPKGAIASLISNPWA